MSAALGDAAWMTGMERNSDLVVMSSYAPLFVNVNKGAMQWRTDLIGYDGLKSYGSPAYWAQQMFSAHHGDLILATDSQGVPTRAWQPPAPRPRPAAPGAQPPAPLPAPPPVEVPTLFFDATRNSQTGEIFLKVVNRASAPPAHPRGTQRTVERRSQGTSHRPDRRQPQRHQFHRGTGQNRPRHHPVDGLGATFTRTFPPYSITVLVMKAK